MRSGPGTERAGALAALLLAFAMAGCGESPPSDDAAGDQPPVHTAGSIEVTDPAGRRVTLAEPARRVVSLSPAITEWIMAMGGTDRLVARTRYDLHPELSHLPSVGGGLTPSIEWLTARRPDLVVAWTDAPTRSLVSRLEDMGIAVYTAPIETVDEGLDAARDMGRLLGLGPAADSAVSATMAGLDAVRAAIAGEPRPGVLFLIGLDPLMAAGPGTFVDELVTAAGGRNVLEGTARWPQLSREAVLDLAPELIIVGTKAEDPAARLVGAAWREVPAVRDGRVHSVDPDLVNRPGPGMDEAAGLLSRLLHPEAAR